MLIIPYGARYKVAAKRGLTMLIICWAGVTFAQPATKVAEVHIAKPSVCAADSLTTISKKLAEIHGGAGPWTLLGYRMGVYAAAKLNAPPYSRMLDVTHRAVMIPEFTCIADGLAAATGNSLGQMNLRIDEVGTTASMETTFKRLSNNDEMHLRLRPEVYARFQEVPMTPESFREANLEIMQMTDDELFTE